MKDTGYYDICRLLKDVRVRSGCTQQQVANRLKIDLTTWQEFESGKEAIPFKKLMSACIYCNMLCSFLMIVPTGLLPHSLKSQARLVKTGFKERL